MAGEGRASGWAEWDAGAVESAAPRVNWRGSPAPTPCLPRDSAGASLSSLCVKGSGLAAVTWRAAGSASTRLSVCAFHEDAARGACCPQPRGPRGVSAASLGPGVGRARRRGARGPPASATLAGVGAGGQGERGPGRESASGPRGLGFLGAARSPAALLPSPCPEQSPPCALRGRERKGGKSYFSKLLSSGGGGGGLPVTHVGAGRAGNGWGAVIFRNAGKREPRLAALSSAARPSPRSPSAVPTPPASGPDPREAPVQKTQFGGRAARGRGDAAKVAVSLPCSPQPPGRGRAHSGDPGGPDPRRGVRGLCFRGALPPGGVCANLGVRKTGAWPPC